MATSKDLVAALRAEMRSAGITYAMLAQRLALSESTVKRMFARGDMSLERLDAILRVLRVDLTDLYRHIAQAPAPPAELSVAQERALVADRRLMLAAICCQSEWRFEQMLAFYRFEEAELIGHLARLDRLGLIELRPGNRYALKLAKSFRWRPHGPVMAFFRERAMGEYFAGGFDGTAEALYLVHGSFGESSLQEFHARLQQLAHDVARQHLADHALPVSQRRSFTVVLAMREWLFSAFADLSR